MRPALSLVRALPSSGCSRRPGVLRVCGASSDSAPSQARAAYVRSDTDVRSLTDELRSTHCGTLDGAHTDTHCAVVLLPVMVFPVRFPAVPLCLRADSDPCLSPDLCQRACPSSRLRIERPHGCSPSACLAVRVSRPWYLGPAREWLVQSGWDICPMATVESPSVQGPLTNASPVGYGENSASPPLSPTAVDRDPL